MLSESAKDLSLSRGNKISLSPQGVHADRASITLVEDDDDDVKYNGSNRELSYQVLKVDCGISSY